MLTYETSHKSHVQYDNPNYQIIVGETVALLPNWPTAGNMRNGNPFHGNEDGFPYLRSLEITDANGKVTEGVRLGIAEGSPHEDSRLNPIEQSDIIFKGRRPVVVRAFQNTVDRLVEAAKMKPGLDIVRAEQDKYTPTARTEVETITPGYRNYGDPIKERSLVVVSGVSVTRKREKALKLFSHSNFITTGAQVWGANGETFGEEAWPNRLPMRAVNARRLQAQSRSSERVARQLNLLSGVVLRQR